MPQKKFGRDFDVAQCRFVRCKQAALELILSSLPAQLALPGCLPLALLVQLALPGRLQLALLASFALCFDQKLLEFAQLYQAFEVQMSRLFEHLSSLSSFHAPYCHRGHRTSLIFFRHVL